MGAELKEKLWGRPLRKQKPDANLSKSAEVGLCSCFNALVTMLKGWYHYLPVGTTPLRN